MNLTTITEKTGTAGVTYIRERFADWNVAWVFACWAGATKNLLVFDYGCEPDGAFFIDMMNYSPHAFPDGKPWPSPLAAIRRAELEAVNQRPN